MFEHEGMIYSSPPCRISYEMGLKAQQLPKLPKLNDKYYPLILGHLQEKLVQLVEIQEMAVDMLSWEDFDDRPSDLDKTIGLINGQIEELKELINETNSRAQNDNRV